MMGSADGLAVPSVKPSRRPPGDWVSKSEMTQFFRCPYTYWLLYHGEIDRSQVLDGFTVMLVEHGVDFHEEVVAAELTAGVCGLRPRPEWEGADSFPSAGIVCDRCIPAERPASRTALLLPVAP
jgi:hypothetical protein